MRKPKERALRCTASDKPAAELAPNAPEYGAAWCGSLREYAGMYPISSSSGLQPGGEYPRHRIILPLRCEPLEQGGGLQSIVID